VLFVGIISAPGYGPVRSSPRQAQFVKEHQGIFIYYLYSFCCNNLITC